MQAVLNAEVKIVRQGFACKALWQGTIHAMRMNNASLISAVLKTLNAVQALSQLEQHAQTMLNVSVNFAPAKFAPKVARWKAMRAQIQTNAGLADAALLRILGYA